MACPSLRSRVGLETSFLRRFRIVPRRFRMKTRHWQRPRRSPASWFVADIWQFWPYAGRMGQGPAGEKEEAAVGSLSRAYGRGKTGSGRQGAEVVADRPRRLG